MKQLNYIDESLFNPWMHSRKGWNPKGEPLNFIVGNSKGDNISFVLPIYKFPIRTGAYPKDTYQEFIVEL